MAMAYRHRWQAEIAARQREAVRERVARIEKAASAIIAGRRVLERAQSVRLASPRRGQATRAGGRR